jgi:hypothetical protein
VRIDEWHHTYAELTNMGNRPINLSEFELGNMTAWDNLIEMEDGSLVYPQVANHWMMLPDYELQPGESYLIAAVRDWLAEESVRNPQQWGPTTKTDIWNAADLEIHVGESPSGGQVDSSDSISVDPETGFDWQGVLESWNGRDVFFLRHHFVDPDTGAKDSIVVDAVNGVFTTDAHGRPDDGPTDVAGMENATDLAILVRKANIKTGSTDWEAARGTDIEDSEWLPIPTLSGTGGFEGGRKAFWTIDNHGDYHLEDLTSDVAEIDWDNETLTVDWGARNLDSIMNIFNYTEGIGWHYDFAQSTEDSAYVSARTGDILTLYAAGNTLEKAELTINVNPPAENEARVIPKYHKNYDGSEDVFWDDAYVPYVVTTNDPVIDTIREVPFGERVDTLFKYLEKPELASWEIDWVDDTERPDVVRGDKLVVTAEDGSTTKEYYIYVEDYYPSHNGYLSSITWPDIPDFYKGIMGWKGDTIPGFSQSVLDYVITIPDDEELIKGIPNLVAKAADVNTDVQVERATTLDGTEAQRTVQFHTTAEDDTTMYTYTIRFEKEKKSENVEPYEAEPFFSQISWRMHWAEDFIEIYNPGTEPLDLSRYVIVNCGTSDGQTYNAVTAYASDSEDDFRQRYRRYVPGKLWANDLAAWQENPAILEDDYAVNSIVQSGDVFVMAYATPSNYTQSPETAGFVDEIDVNFMNGQDPWGLDDIGRNYNEVGAEYTNNPVNNWYNNTYYLYKITNDSVVQGLKPLTSANDVEVIDIFGRGNGEDWGNVEGIVVNQIDHFRRKKEVIKGNPFPGDSFGSGEEGTSEWIHHNRDYYSENYAYPTDCYMPGEDIGKHMTRTITEHLSTITSPFYLVSEGYGSDETINDVTSGTTVSEFLAKILKKNESQTLTVLSDGTELSDGDEISDGDQLKVESLLGGNETLYTITVTEEGLDSNAILTSDVYTIEVDGSEGTISGFEPGTTLREVVENITVPETVRYFSMFNDDGSYAALTQLNFDTVYVDVLATNNVNFEVLAQDGATKITYDLVPNESASDAFVYSNTFEVDQDMFLIDEVPNGTSVSAFFKNLTPSAGATIELQNKMGQVREMGTVYKDDKLLVTSEDSETQNVYSLQLLSDESASYLAFLYSEAYVVAQGENTVVVEGSHVASTDFLDNVSTSLGASVELLDADGNEKTAENMEEADQVVVTSADGTVTNTYTIVLDLTSVEDQAQQLVEVYPNPTSGAVNISGVEAGNTIRVFNNVGQNVLNMKAGASKVTAPLYGQPAGIYMIIVNDGAKDVAKFKLIKK